MYICSNLCLFTNSPTSHGIPTVVEHRFFSCLFGIQFLLQPWLQLRLAAEGSATEQNGVQDLKISLRSQDFYGISIFHRDFKISYGFQYLNEISQDLTKIS